MYDEVDFYLEDLKSKFTKINYNDYYLSYSGGRDSHLLYWFIKEYLKDTKIKIVSVNTRMEHPEILRRMILASSPSNGVVLDPFMGSGSTAAACVLNDRNYIGFEINPKYCKIAEKRIKRISDNLFNSSQKTGDYSKKETEACYYGECGVKKIAKRQIQNQLIAGI